MGKEPVEKTIGKETYIFYYLAPRISTKVLVKLTKIVGPALGAVFPEDKSIKINDILDMDIKIGDAISILVDKIDADETQMIIDTLFTSIICKGRGKLSEEGVYNELFTGDLKLLFIILKESLEVQYGSFFGESNVL